MSLTNDLVKAMVDIRDQDRVECGRYLFERLGHNDSAFITESQLDELLFMTVRKRLGTSIYADMLLMAFGLLPGYEYENLTIGKRREKFLRESNWLKVNKKSKIENYDSASKEELESVLKSLRNVERHWMKQIANELTEQIKLKDKDGDEIKDALEKYIILLKNNMEAVQDAYGKIIDYVPKVSLSLLPDNKDCATNEAPPDSVEPNEQEVLEEVAPLDEPTTGSFSENDPVTTGGQQDNRSKADSQSDDSTPPSKPSKIHISKNIIESIVIQFNGENIRWQCLILPVCFVVFGIAFIYACFQQLDNEPSIPNNVLIPGEIEQLVIVWPSNEPIDGLLEYVSSDPSLIEVSNGGFILAHQGQPGESSRSAEIRVLDETGIIATESYTVDFTKDSYDPPVDDINDFVPDYSIEQKVRLAGTTEWKTSVDAKVGDKVEFQVQYKNTSNDAITHRDVTIKDILPKNMQYVKGTTKLFNSNHPNGMNILSDTITDYGINIGHYDKGANAYVRFTAEVVDKSLQCGSNTLVNWTQGSVGKVTLQDYACVVVQKVK